MHQLFITDNVSKNSTVSSKGNVVGGVTKHRNALSYPGDDVRTNKFHLMLTYTSIVHYTTN